MFRSTSLYLTLFMCINTIIAKGILLCPSKCPSCTKCDPWKGLCLLPRDFVTCKTINNQPGLCYAGTCKTNLQLLPSVQPLGLCQTYDCNSSGVCTFTNKIDGTDCTQQSQVGAKTPYVCSQGACRQVVIGLTDLPPWRNIGCTGLPDNTPCDTNNVFGDGEVCIRGICTFPNGNAYGIVN